MKLLAALVTVAMFLTIGVVSYIVISEKTLENAKKDIATPVTFTGTVQKVFDTGVTYSHLLKGEHSVIPINSSAVSLDDYIGGTVEITGHYIEKTLFVDLIREKK